MNKEELIAKLDRLFPDKRFQNGEGRYFYKNMRFGVRGGSASPMLITWRLIDSFGRFYYFTHTYPSGYAQSRLYIL